MGCSFVGGFGAVRCGAVRCGACAGVVKGGAVPCGAGQSFGQARRHFGAVAMVALRWGCASTSALSSRRVVKGWLEVPERRGAAGKEGRAACLSAVAAPCLPGNGGQGPSFAARHRGLTPKACASGVQQEGAVRGVGCARESQFHVKSASSAGTDCAGSFYFDSKKGFWKQVLKV